MMVDNWTTYLKARLNCSTNGDYPFYFDELQSALYIPEENLIYGIFSTSINSIAGSAICSFDLSAVERAFSGPFKYQEHINSSWDKHYSQNQEHFQCKGSIHSKNTIESSKYQLMDSAVQATALKPLHVAELERYIHLTIDILSTKLHKSVHMLYVATIQGLIKKISILPSTQETCVIEIWQAVSDTNIAIKNIQFLKATNSLYIGTEIELIRLPVEHCDRHVSRKSCLNAMDPYCGWNVYNYTCSTAPQYDPLVKYWIQNVSSCPIVDAYRDGGKLFLSINVF